MPHEAGELLTITLDAEQSKIIQEKSKAAGLKPDVYINKLLAPAQQAKAWNLSDFVLLCAYWIFIGACLIYLWGRL